MKRLTTEEIVQRFKAKHGKTYTYKNVEYVGLKDKVQIRCKKHGYFLQSPENHLAGQGCPRCNGVRALTTKEFVQRAKQKHGTTYGYKKVNYETNNQYVVITCKKHGDFEQLPSNHLLGYGCSRCAAEKSSRNQQKSQKQFISEAKAVHGNTYAYKNCLYKNQRTRVSVTCRKHGDFEIFPTNLLNGSGCAQCQTRGYSKIAIRWIEEYAKKHRLKNVQHSLNNGEFRVPGTRYKVDGYHEASNTIFEFYGDAYHGNPNRYAPRDKCHPYNKAVTARTLYNRTMKRENELRALGFNVVSVWESDYR